ncbi:hypothetical protein K439DRAFT_797993 [Ramaria rubella]|nr:hypothetical protein K439DRAFT_797993 [Ramaria rubella]
MCNTVVAGDTKYLICGHISNSYTTAEDCYSSRCINSQYHASWDCSYGRRSSCNACAHIVGACPRHHSCRRESGYAGERYRRQSAEICPSCRPDY